MMLHKISSLFFASIVFISCGSNVNSEKIEVAKIDSVSATIETPLTECEGLFKEAKQSDDILLRATVVNPDVAARAIIAFFNYANLCKNDSLAPVFLIKAGQVAQSIGKFDQAQTFFTKCKDDFPKFKNRGAALFLLAQLFDDASKLNNEENASKIYKQIIKEYPNSTFAEDSKACLKNIGKTDEQLVQEFLKKNK